MRVRIRYAEAIKLAHKVLIRDPAPVQDVSDAEEAAPAVIREEPLLTLWYRPDKAFCTPKAVVCGPFTWHVLLRRDSLNPHANPHHGLTQVIKKTSKSAVSLL